MEDIISEIENDQEYLDLQKELVLLQKWIIKNDKRLLLIFEGRDSAGKTGTVKRFTQYINPKHYKVIALEKPTDVEQKQWYFQRYLHHLPDAGEITLFDRSWYNRALVEPVMGFCTDEQYHLFMNQVNDVEKMLVDDGIHIIKFWFTIDKEEQKERLDERSSSLLTSWKISPVDLKAQAKWEEYTQYKKKMFSVTGTKKAPWIVIEGNHKKSARLEAMRYVLNLFDYDEKGVTGVSLTPDKDIYKIVSS
ncbi:polyphosphate kinase 2 [Tenacibaculum sp. IB213877]|uniref:polyphosphate kinase 2 n=1 Tax=Tenacibaculum sp. IB213877 TaxID=3097351 RepID=UPI002A5A0051|nr:polyphosphate kinase 2 [Tenacibaculum sp. IB213877]MDY0780392.1 polyphosphate kinase 2 [Tenacibaculum sp. IB213877]